MPMFLSLVCLPASPFAQYSGVSDFAIGLLNYKWAKYGPPTSVEDKMILGLSMVAGFYAGWPYWKLKMYSPLLMLWLARPDRKLDQTVKLETRQVNVNFGSSPSAGVTSSRLLAVSGSFYGMLVVSVNCTWKPPVSFSEIRSIPGE